MSGEINVLSRTQVINVEPFSRAVSIINAGPAGPGVVQGVPKQTYTPTLGGTGWSLGTTGAICAGTYADIGQWVLLHIELRFGTGMTQGTGGLTLSTPIPCIGGKGFHGIGQLQDTSVPAYYGCVANIWSGGPVEVYPMTASGAYVGYTGLTTGVPFAWTSNDYIELDIAYETAA